MNKEFIFIMSPYEETVLPEISKVLEQMVQNNSRKKYPGLWKMVDKLNEKRSPEAVLKRRRAREKRWGGLLLVMGIFLFVPGLMKPQELPVPLIAGLFAILLGLFYVRPDRKKKNTFEASARKLLSELNPLMKEQKFRISFVEDEVVFSEEGEEAVRVAKDQLEYAFETKELFMVIYDKKILVFQKKELLLGKEEEFRKRLLERVEFQKI